MCDDDVGYLAGSLLEVGSDTTSGVIIGFIQAMMLFPSVQEKAQEEVDRVVGADRLPTIDDDLPYIRSCVKESIRWMPIAILGIQHSVIQDDHYMGYRVPAGANIITDVWALHMDPERNPNPGEFNPDRFENDPRTEFETVNGEATKRNNYVFGSGRRMCKGMHIAERSLFLTLSRIIWAFNISSPPGKPLPDADDIVGGLVVQPADFEAVIKPRSEMKASLVKEIWSGCEESLLDRETKQWRRVPEGMKFGTYKGLNKV